MLGIFVSVLAALFVFWIFLICVENPALFLLIICFLFVGGCVFLMVDNKATPNKEKPVEITKTLKYVPPSTINENHSYYDEEGIILHERRRKVKSRDITDEQLDILRDSLRCKEYGNRGNFVKTHCDSL